MVSLIRLRFFQGPPTYTASFRRNKKLHLQFSGHKLYFKAHFYMKNPMIKIQSYTVELFFIWNLSYCDNLSGIRLACGGLGELEVCIKKIDQVQI